MRSSFLGDLVFSIKTFAAAMLALYLAFSLDLPRPYWALITTYIVARPLSGMMRSKALYRFSGTLIGAAMAVILVPAFVNAPELLNLVLALWVAACLFLSLLQPAPRNYAFRLSGYTAALVGFPCFNTPDHGFQIGLVRVEEISLGLACASLIGDLVFPRRAGRYLLARLDAWLAAGGRWASDVLQGRETGVDQRHFIAQAAGLAELRVHAAYDTPALRASEAATQALYVRIGMIAPLVFGLADRLRALGSGTAGLSPVLSMLAKWMSAGQRGTAGDATPIREAITAERSPDLPLLTAGTLAQLDDLTRLWRGCLELRQRLRGGINTPGYHRVMRDDPIDRDPVMAAFSAFALFVAILVCSGASIVAGWAGGATATMMAATTGAVLAAQDDQARAMVRFSLWITVGALFAGLWLFAVMPAIDGFPLLVFSLGLVLVPTGVAAARRATAGSAIAFIYGFGGLMALQATYAIDFASWLNSVLSVMVGTWTVAIVMRLVRTVSPEWTVRRLLAAGRADLTEIARGRWTPEPADFVERMLDRIVAIGPRFGASKVAAGSAQDDALADLRAGLNLLKLRRACALLAPSARKAVDLVLESLARYFAGHPMPALHRRVELALSRIGPRPQSQSALDAALALDELQRSLWRVPSPIPLPAR